MALNFGLSGYEQRMRNLQMYNIPLTVPSYNVNGFWRTLKHNLY